LVYALSPLLTLSAPQSLLNIPYFFQAPYLAYLTRRTSFTRLGGVGGWVSERGEGVKAGCQLQLPFGVCWGQGFWREGLLSFVSSPAVTELRAVEGVTAGRYR